MIWLVCLGAIKTSLFPNAIFFSKLMAKEPTELALWSFSLEVLMLLSSSLLADLSLTSRSLAADSSSVSSRRLSSMSSSILLLTLVSMSASVSAPTSSLVTLLSIPPKKVTRVRFIFYFL